MRQLVSVVTDTSIMFLIHDGDTTEQIAQVINRGLDVAAVVRLGINLDEALTLNGRTTPKAQRALPPADEAQRRRIASGSGSRPKPTATWEQLVICPVPGCEHVAKRSNLPGHLMTLKHGYTKEMANAAARNAHTLDPAEVPPPKPKKKAGKLPRGVAGQRHIAGTVAPMFKAFADTQPFITSRMCADHFNMDPSRCRKVIATLVTRGELVDVTPSTATMNDARQYAAAATT